MIYGHNDAMPPLFHFALPLRQLVTRFHARHACLLRYAIIVVTQFARLCHYAIYALRHAFPATSFLDAATPAI